MGSEVAELSAASPRMRSSRSGSKPQSGRVAKKVKAPSRPSLEASERFDIQATMRKRDRSTMGRPPQIAWKAPQRPVERSAGSRRGGAYPRQRQAVRDDSGRFQ